MIYERIEQPQWRRFCDFVSTILQDRPMDFEVAGLDIGDQISGQWLTLSGISYDPMDNVVQVFVDTGGGLHLAHLIPTPKELYAEISERGLSEIVVIDAEDRRHFMRLREVLSLPAPKANVAS